MNWMEEHCDEEAILFGNFDFLKEHLHVSKENFLFLKAEDDAVGLRTSCFVYWLMQNLDFKDVNIVLWASTDMTHTTEQGPWMRTIYQNNEGETLTAVRHFAQHVKIPAENVLFLVPGDEFAKDKLAEFVSNLLSKYQWTNPTVVAWFKCQDGYCDRTLKRMLV